MMPLQRFHHYAERIRAFNPALNAYLHLRLDAAETDAAASEARVAAGKPLSQIDGWCIAVKANIAVTGLPHHAGIGAYRDDIAQEDAEVVRRLKASGAVILGIVNMHEGALGATTDNAFFGRTVNPWKEGYTPGGSSGGSGAAVAAGLCNVALGSDTMGSVRIPSAYCGVQGFKPGPGVLSNRGVLALSETLDTIGPHARNIDSLRKVLAVMSGAEAPASRLPLEGLRIGVWAEAGKAMIDPAVKDGFHRALAKLEAAGATTKAFTPPIYASSLSRRAGLLVSEVEAHAIHAERLKQNPDGFSPLFRKLLEWGAAQAPDRVAAAYEHICAIAASAPAVFEAHDFVIAPVAPQTAFSFDAPVPETQADFTAWANLAGLPAAAVYTGLSPEGLPLSVQVIGPQGADSRLLDFAEAVEQVFGLPPLPPGF
ncbi:amidase [Hyphomonas sp.]|uniref:amidase n=1 Tax=Hyphomonas sp. TaxID=87 RepID=UPI00391CB9F2